MKGHATSTCLSCKKTVFHKTCQRIHRTMPTTHKQTLQTKDSISTKHFKPLKASNKDTKPVLKSLPTTKRRKQAP